MQIGVPKEIKNHEYRVGLTPASVRALIQSGHTVWVERHAGDGVGFPDPAYEAVGARMASDAQQIFQSADMIVKVKEPQPQECALLQARHILFTYLHLAPDPQQADALLASGCTAVAYETVTDHQGGLPLLAPMSEVAGRMSIQAGAFCLEKAWGGSGVLLGGVPGVEPGHVVVLGGGVVGTHAIRMAMGMEADVTVLDRSLSRLRTLDLQFGRQLKTIYSTDWAVAEHVKTADLVVGAVLVAGAAAPQLVTRDMLKTMRPGSVLVDVAIDQGGCFETSRPTTHTAPTFVEEGIVHYCVANMPGAVARTSTVALNNATLPYVLALADHGEQALLDDPHFLAGLNVCRGHVTHEAIATALGRSYHDARSVLSIRVA